MQKDGLRRRRPKEPAPKREIQSERAHARRQVRLWEVVATQVSKRFADEKDDIDYRLDSFRRVVDRHVTDLCCFAGNCVAITVDHATGDAREMCNEGRSETLRRSKIE